MTSEAVPQRTITIEPTGRRVTVRVGGTTVADTTAALTLLEEGHRPVQYLPLADVDRSLLRPSTKQTYCPYKGDCSYYSIATPDAEVVDAVWFYPEPYPGVAAIAGHVAFYTDRVDLAIEPQ